LKAASWREDKSDEVGESHTFWILDGFEVSNLGNTENCLLHFVDWYFFSFLFENNQSSDKVSRILHNMMKAYKFQEHSYSGTGQQQRHSII
jgi:hypothetical protein